MTRLTEGAAASATRIPPRVEPVKDTTSISSCAAMACPTSGPSPFTRLNTPAGTPASSRISASLSALSGVYSDGFRTTGHPAAKAEAILLHASCTGQFHGVMRPATPIASWRMMLTPSRVSNAKSRSVAAACLSALSPAPVCAVSETGAPISSVRQAMISSERRP